MPRHNQDSIACLRLANHPLPLHLYLQVGTYFTHDYVFVTSSYMYLPTWLRYIDARLSYFFHIEDTYVFYQFKI